MCSASVKGAIWTVHAELAEQSDERSGERKDGLKGSDGIGQMI
jgi:hypothetical protein